ncbi:MAG: O-antigen ligase family protein [Candidatus Aminicenantes bacterium]|nr:O-antigen ligase family protein [Candidatus Aminicenantes bacterium]
MGLFSVTLTIGLLVGVIVSMGSDLVKVAVAICAGILFFILAFLKPKGVLLIIGFIIPLEKFGALGVGPIEYITVAKALGLLLFTSVVVRSLVRRRPIITKMNSLDCLVIIYIIGAVIPSLFRLFLNDSYTTNILVLTVAISYISLLAFYLVVRSLCDAQLLDKLWRAVLFGFLLSTAISLTPLGMEVINGVAFRASGGFLEENNAGLNGLIALAIAIWLAFTSRSKKGQLFGILSVGASLMLVVRSFSRGAAVGLAVLLILFPVILWKEHKRLALSKKRIYWRAILLISLSVLIVLGSMLITDMSPYRYWERLATIANVNKDASIDSRLAAWKIGLQLFQQSPVFGTGIGSIPVFSVDMLPSRLVNLGVIAIGSHNTYISILAESGLVGFLPFVAMLVLCFKAFLSSGGSPRSIKRALFVGLGAFLVGAVFLDSRTEKLFYLLIASAGVIVSFADKALSDRNIGFKKLKIVRNSR